MGDKQPAEQRHGKRLDQPVDAHGRSNAAPVRLDLPERAEVDLEQHRDDHEPDQHGDGEIDLRHGRSAQSMKHARDGLAETNTDDDAERHP